MKIFKLIFVALVVTCCHQNEKQSGESVHPNQFNTAQGPVDEAALGITLSHEHVMSNFGKDIGETAVYDSIRLFEQVIPYLKELKSLGVASLFDCTTEYFGRRIDLLKALSEATGIQIITNTGFYGAADDRYIPDFAYQANPETIAAGWIKEFEQGIQGTGVKPGFIKLAFDEGKPPSEIDSKLFEAGLLTHLSTGLTLAVHTGNNLEAAKVQEALLNQYGVDASAWIWTHANKVEDDRVMLERARQGAWISLDGVKTSNIDEYLKRLVLFKEHNLLNKVLLSHDGNGFPGGGEIRKFEAIFTHLIPAMKENGFSEEDIRQLLVENPREAFKIRTRTGPTS